MVATTQASPPSPPAIRTAPDGFAASTPRGLLAEENSGNGPGLNAPTTRVAARNNPITQASGRQRREGSLPSGNSSTRKRIQTGNEFWASMASQAASAPPGRTVRG
jgi:hypothetical protein